MQVKVSVIIITLNEEMIIEKCLSKLSWADEILVIDSGSTDQTVAICEKMGAKVIHNKFINFGIQKQFALNQTKNKWVLSLDADEILSDGLITEIQQLDFSRDFYYIPITHVFLNKKFLFGSENKRPNLRLFNKEKGKFAENRVHEKITICGQCSHLKNEVLHYTVFDFKLAVAKQIKYALLGAECLFEKGKKASLFKCIVKFPYEFSRVYFLQRNFLNSYQGFVWSMLVAFGSFVKYAKLYDLHQNKSE